MSTKINGIDSKPTPVSGGQPVARVRNLGTEDRGGAPPSSAENGVVITAAARQLAELEQMIAAVPAVNEGRVAEVRRALEEGRYAIDAPMIAARLVRLERELAAFGLKE